MPPLEGRRVVIRGCLTALSLLGLACGGASSGATPAPTPGPAGRFLFAAGESSSTVRAWSIDAVDGHLTAIGDVTLSGGARALALTVDASGRSLFVARSGGRGGIDVFSINRATGALTPTPGSPFDLDHQADALIADRLGRSLFAVRTFNSRIDVFTIDASGGALSERLADALSLSVAPVAPWLRPDGRFLYFGVGGSPGMMSATVEVSTGRLSPGPAAEVRDFVRSLATDPAGAFLYVTTTTPLSSNTIFAFRIGADTGAVTPFAGSVFASGFDAATANLRPDAVTFDPVGRFVYILDRAGRTGAHSRGVFVFPVQPNGVFGPSFLGPFSTPATEPFLNGDPIAFAMDPSGRFAYLADATSGALSAFTIDATTGALTSSGAPAPTTGLAGASLLAITP